MARRHQADVAAEGALEHRRHQRVVGAAEDDGVDLGLAQRLAVGADHLHHALVEGETALDHGGERRGLDLGHGERPVRGGQRAAVGAAPDGRRGREHADLPVVGHGRRDLGLGLDHRHDLDPVLGGDLAGRLKPAEVAELQAITSSFAPRPSRNRETCSTWERSCSSVRAPYGKRASSPR